jgi:hypothetical protein
MKPGPTGYEHTRFSGRGSGILSPKNIDTGHTFPL